MSFVNPTVGDMQYSQYAVIDTIPIKSGVSISKGSCYTIDADGELIALTGASGALSNLNGIFQAMTTPKSTDTRVQCLQKRSRILLKAPADVTKGDSVSIAVTTNVVTADKVQIATTNIIGTVFEITAITDARIPKVKTADNDLVLVDLLE